MKDIERQIEIDSYAYVASFKIDDNSNRIGEAFRRGAKSQAAKEFWQQGMYTKEDLYDILNNFRKQFSLHRGIQIMDFDIKEFINNNNKK